MLELNSKQRKFLEKEAHNLSPVVIIGGAGVTEGVINMVSSSIASHELIKVKFNEYKDEKSELTEEILESTDTTLVRMIGNVIILYKPAENEENVRLFLDAHPDFAPLDFSFDGGLASKNGYITLLPHKNGTDGFFMAKLTKRI